MGISRWRLEKQVRKSSRKIDRPLLTTLLSSTVVANVAVDRRKEEKQKSRSS